jgi:hypothetical protein
LWQNKSPYRSVLSYGGIKVEEVASSVGLGWAFNNGGVITRNVRGMPDDKTYIGGSLPERAYY